MALLSSTAKMPSDFDPALEVAIIVRQCYEAVLRRVRERQLGEAFLTIPPEGTCLPGGDERT